MLLIYIVTLAYLCQLWVSLPWPTVLLFRPVSRQARRGFCQRRKGLAILALLAPCSSQLG